MKKIITLILAATMLVSVFAGCSPQDKELYDAIIKTEASENFTKTITITPRLTVNEPVSNNEAETLTPPLSQEYSVADSVSAVKADNNFLSAVADMVNDIEITAVSKRDSSKGQLNVLAAKPDIETEVTLWSEKTDDNLKYTAKIPSYLFNEKDYAVISSKDIEEGNNTKAPIKIDNALIENGLTLFVDNLKTSLTTKDSDGAYVLTLNDSALDSLTKEILEASDNNLVMNFVTMLIYAQLNEADMTFDEVQTDIKEFLSEAEVVRSSFFSELKDNGIAAEGLTCKYYLNKDGLVDKTEGKLSFIIDISTDFGERFYQEFFPNGYMYEYVPSGKFTFDINFTESYSYGNAKVELPSVTEENSVDLGKQYVEYKEFERKRMEKLNTWSFYEPFSIDSAKPLKIKNIDNGREVEAFAFPSNINGNDGYYFPLKELASLYDGMEISWNNDLMGVVISYPQYSFSDTQSYYVIFNANGLDMYNAYYWEDEEIEIPDATLKLFESYEYYSHMFITYDYSNHTYASYGYFDENGKAYVDLNQFFSVFDNGYAIEGNTINITDWYNIYDTPDEMYDNFFYKYF